MFSPLFLSPKYSSMAGRSSARPTTLMETKPRAILRTPTASPSLPTSCRHHSAHWPSVSLPHGCLLPLPLGSTSLSHYMLASRTERRGKEWRKQKKKWRNADGFYAGHYHVYVLDNSRKSPSDFVRNTFAMVLRCTQLGKRNEEEIKKKVRNACGEWDAESKNTELPFVWTWRRDFFFRLAFLWTWRRDFLWVNIKLGGREETGQLVFSQFYGLVIVLEWILFSAARVNFRSWVCLVSEFSDLFGNVLSYQLSFLKFSFGIWEFNLF